MLPFHVTVRSLGSTVQPATMGVPMSTAGFTTVLSADGTATTGVPKEWQTPRR